MTYCKAQTSRQPNSMRRQDFLRNYKAMFLDRIMKSPVIRILKGWRPLRLGLTIPFIGDARGRKLP
jgi:hypothetical protein